MFKKIYIEIGNLCNLHCHFCSLDGRKKQIMSVEDFSKIVRQAKKFTDNIYLHVKGEPLIHPDFDEILAICTRENVKVNITTNATKLQEKFDCLTKSPCIRQVNISAHALSEISLDRRGEYLNGILEMIKYVSLNKTFYLSIRLWVKNVSITKLILDYLNDNLKLEEKITIDSKKIVDNVYLSVDEEFEWPSLTSKFVSEKGRCYGSRDQIAILANGDVVPCCLDSSANIVLGNCLNDSLENILSSERFKKMQEGFKRGIVIEELCKHCSYRLRFK